jgi:hypothetical protein
MSGKLGVILALVGSTVLVGLGVMSFHEGTAKSRPVVLPFDLFWCEKDEDCVVVERIGCCDCWQGGGQAAVTTWHADDLRRFLKHACQRAEQVCVQVDVCRSDVLPRCIDRQCKLVLAQ